MRPQTVDPRITAALWLNADLPHLLDALSRRAGIAVRPITLGPPPARPEFLAAWLEGSCAAFGIEAEAVDVWGFRIETMLRSAAPALVPLAGRGWLGLLAVTGDRAVLVAPDLSTLQLELPTLVRALHEKHCEPFRAELEKLLEDCGVAPARRERAMRAMLRERTRYALIAEIWPLRTPPGHSFRQQIAAAGLFRRAAWLGLAHLSEYLLWIAAWYILGSDALEGRLDPGWLAAWGLVLATIVPFRLLTTWLQGSIAIAGGGLLRQRLLDGALQLDAEEVRHEGAGRFLGRAIETESIESLALSGGMLAALAVFELLLAAAVLALGSAGPLHAVALAGCLSAALALAWRYHRRRLDWTVTRLSMTHDLVERMTGRRTRLAQESPADWHLAEDQALRNYLAHSTAMDRAAALLTGLMPRLWLVAGIAALVPAFLGNRPAQGALAVSLGGLLLAWQGFRRLTAGLASLAGAAISWKQVAPLFQAAARRANQRPAAFSPPGSSGPVLDARGVTFQYPGRDTRVLNAVDLLIGRGDWVLLEGESGGGKSTLISVLTGLREADSGLLLTGGLDRQTLGPQAWRRRIAAAPQYHENHILSGPFAFNLLLGRKWPAGPSEMNEAHEICRELGLGPLIDRMPGGMMQMVGETGWQLSQGECSRVFMARALLQNPSLVVLDESFGSLDPENLRQSLECVLRRAGTLLVVAHP